jgi:putative transposase
MLFHKILSQVVNIAQCIVKDVETRFKAWFEPAADGVVGRVAADLVKSKQQVIVLKRQVARRQLTAKDRGLLVLLASRVRDWKNALLLVKPETLRRWH